MDKEDLEDIHDIGWIFHGLQRHATPPKDPWAPIHWNRPFLHNADAIIIIHSIETLVSWRKRTSREWLLTNSWTAFCLGLLFRPLTFQDNNHFGGVEKCEYKVLTEPDSTNVFHIILILSRSFFHPNLTFFSKPPFLTSFSKLPRWGEDLPSYLHLET